MLPDFDERGNLPPGRHRATWQEMEQRYGLNEHRRRLLAGMKRMLLSLKSVGCSISDVERIVPFSVEKRDRRGWVTFDVSPSRKQLWMYD